MSGTRTPKILILICLLVVLLMAPQFISGYRMIVLRQMACFALYSVSFALCINGNLLSFGHCTFFGVGAYATALVILSFPGFPLVASILIGVFAGGITAVIIGIVCVRSTRMYFALLCLAFSQFFYAIALKWREVTGGDDGLRLPRIVLGLPFIGNIEMGKGHNAYYLIIGVVLICLYICWYITRTPFGNASRCVKQNEERANFMGYNPYMTKVILFSIGGLFAAFSGSLFAISERFVAIDVFSIGTSLMPLLTCLIGGTGHFLGPVLGTIIYVYLMDTLSRYTSRWELFIGIIFVAVVMYFPGGFVSLFARFGKMRIINSALKRIQGLRGYTNPE